MFGIVAIKGNQISQIAEVMQNFGYSNRCKINSFESHKEMQEFLFSNYFEKAQQNKGIKGIWTDDKWTYVYDPEMVDPTDAEALIKNSTMLNEEIHCLISEAKSGTFAYTKYNQSKKREVFYSCDRLVDDIGDKLEEEITLKLSESLNEEKLIKFSQILGLNIMGENSTGQFDIVEFDLNSQELTKIQGTIQAIETQSKWWKFW